MSVKYNNIKVIFGHKECHRQADRWTDVLNGLRPLDAAVFNLMWDRAPVPSNKRHHWSHPGRLFSEETRAWALRAARSSYSWCTRSLPSS